MTVNETPRRCRACKQGDLLPITWHRTFSPLGEPVTVELLSSQCTHCGAESTSSRQHDENLSRLAARKPAYRHLLMGEEIVAFRMKYGLTQRVAAKIFGKGLIAFSRYENEASYPDLSTTKLLKQAIDRPDVLKALADEEGVEIPLWEARCEDVRRDRLISMVERRNSQSARHDFHRLFADVSEGHVRSANVNAGAYEMRLGPSANGVLAVNETLEEQAAAA